MSCTIPCNRSSSLTVVERLLLSRDLAIELVVSTVVDGSNAESEPRRDGDAESQLARLPVVSDGDTRACLSVELAEGYGNSSLIGC